MPAPYRAVLDEAFPGSEKLRSVALFEMTYTGNCTGGRPSDNARAAVKYVGLALRNRDATMLASPTATAMMTDYLAAVLS